MGMQTAYLYDSGFTFEHHLSHLSQRFAVGCSEGGQLGGVGLCQGRQHLVATLSLIANYAEKKTQNVGWRMKGMRGWGVLRVGSNCIKWPCQEEGP